MASRIFINYRREDSIATSGRLYDRLVLAFGAKNIFMDVDRIPAGVDFVDYLNTQVAECDTFLTVIGPGWLNAKDQSGNRRIDSPEDYVGVEIAAALARNIRVIPVLVDGAQMPKSTELPEPLKTLVRRNAVELRNTQFGRDVESLIDKIRESVEFRGRSRTHWWWTVPAICLIAALSGFLLWRMDVLQLWPSGRKEVAAVPRSEVGKSDAKSKPVQPASEDAKAKAREIDAAFQIGAGSARVFKDTLMTGQPCEACPEMVVVPSGSFTMGSPANEPERGRAENPQTKVAFAQPFAVARYAVTRAQFQAFVLAANYQVQEACYLWVGMGVRHTTGASFRSPGVTQVDSHPAVCINWQDAVAYASWLSKITGKEYGLPSESQREYFTRAGKTGPFWWGPSITPMQANYDGTIAYQGGGALGEYRQTTVPVDAFLPNPWGLYNVHGNIWEWTSDCWNDTNAGNPGNGRARLTGDCNRRVVRGGSWNNQPRVLRAAFRDAYPARDRFNYQGFRVIRPLVPQ